MFFWILISCIILQRVIELIIAKRNEKTMFAKGAVEFDKKGYKYIVIMHTLFFISLIFEWNVAGRVNNYYFIFLILFLSAQVLRYWAIVSLGEFWNTRIIVLKGSTSIKKGPYRYFKHPNYIAVIVELAVIPLIFSCYFTAVFFSVVNFLVLRRRIKIEEEALIIEIWNLGT